MRHFGVPVADDADKPLLVFFRDEVAVFIFVLVIVSVLVFLLDLVRVAIYLDGIEEAGELGGVLEVGRTGERDGMPASRWSAHFSIPIEGGWTWLT